MYLHLKSALKIVILFSSSLSVFGQSPDGRTPASGASSGLPVIQETVPPPFDKYPLGPDSMPQASVPKGKMLRFDMKTSRIFPEAARTISVYVPAAYKADRPACTFIFLDGIGFNAPTVFDNLIAQHAMPVTIAIGVSAGTIDSINPPEDPRFDRSFEFDSMTDRLARFLLEEVIPEVEKHTTPDGLAIKLSSNPDDRAIAGGSTGGIGSFTVAWQHPEAFHHVFTAIGTFVGMRGGQDYYVLVRKTEPKPIRIFMQDGVNDEWGGAEMGDWWMSNLTMYRALSFAGYDVNHVWGAGTHNGTQAAAVFPDAMRWMWRDWPSPITAKPPSNRVLKAVLQSNEQWNLAAAGCAAGLELAANQQGEVYYQSAGTGALPLSAGGTTVACNKRDSQQPFAIGPDGGVYQARPEGGIEVLTSRMDKGMLQKSGRDLHVRSLIVRNNGDIYATTVPRDGQNELWLLPAHGAARKLDEGLRDARGIAVSPDGLWLFVAQSSSRFGISYRVHTDGALDAREPFYDFDVPAGADDPAPAQVAMDSDGRPYVATRMGIQIFDRNGRVAAILPLPGNEVPTGICFGGHDFDTLYVAAGDKIYRRKLRVKGSAPWAAPSKLPPWGAG